jgi:hypothetical protein
LGEGSGIIQIRYEEKRVLSVFHFLHIGDRDPGYSRGWRRDVEGRSGKRRGKREGPKEALML